MTIAPGWYDDGQGNTRWWDGTAWTDHIAPAQPAAPLQPPAAPAAPTPAPAPQINVPVQAQPTPSVPAQTGNAGGGKNHRTRGIVFAGIAGLAVAALIAVLFATGVFRSDESRMEKALTQWITAVQENDLATFEELADPSMLNDEYDESMNDRLQSFREWWPIEGVREVEFASTDFEEGWRKVFASADQEIDEAEIKSALAEMRDNNREMGVDSDKTGLLIFRPEYKAASLEEDAELAERLAVAEFNLEQRSAPRLIYVNMIY